MNKLSGGVLLLAAMALLVAGNSVCHEWAFVARDALPSVASFLLAWLAIALGGWGVLRLHA